MKIELFLKRRPQDCQVLIDGADITNKLTGVKVEVSVHHVPRVTLELLPNEVNVDGIDLEVLYVDKNNKEKETQPTRLDAAQPESIEEEG